MVLPWPLLAAILGLSVAVLPVCTDARYPAASQTRVEIHARSLRAGAMHRHIIVFANRCLKLNVDRCPRG